MLIESTPSADMRTQLRSPFLKGSDFGPLTCLAAEVALERQRSLRLIHVERLSEGVRKLDGEGTKVVRLAEVHCVASVPEDIGCVAAFEAADQRYKADVDFNHLNGFGTAVSWSNTRRGKSKAGGKARPLAA